MDGPRDLDPDSRRRNVRPAGPTSLPPQRNDDRADRLAAARTSSTGAAARRRPSGNARAKSPASRRSGTPPPLTTRTRTGVTRVGSRLGQPRQAPVATTTSMPPAVAEATRGPAGADGPP